MPEIFWKGAGKNLFLRKGFPARNSAPFPQNLINFSKKSNKMITIHTAKTTDGILAGVMGALIANRERDGSGGKGRDARHIVIVPENAALYIELRLMEMLKVSSVFDIEVASFMRLAKKYVSLSGVLTDEGAMMILKKVVADNPDSLKCFKKAAESYGFIKEMYDLIKDIRSSRVDLSIDGARRGLPTKLRYKLDDAEYLYKNYVRELQDKHSDGLSYLEKLYLKIDDIPQLAGARVYIMLYDGFSALEYGIIEKLFANSASVDVGVMSNDGAPNAGVYAEGGVKESLIARAARFKYTVRESRSLPSAVFGHIADNLFSYAKRPKIEANGAVLLIEAENPYCEALFAAREINASVERGAAYGDIAVVAADPVKYSAYIKIVFGRLGIPYSAGAKDKLANGALAKFIKAAAEIYRKRYSAEAFLEFVKNPYSGIETGSGEEFENYCEKRNAEYLSVSFTSNMPDSERDEETKNTLHFKRNAAYSEAEKAELVRIAVLEASDAFKNPNARVTAENFIARVNEFFTRNGIAERTEERTDSESDGEAAYFTAQCYNGIRTILNEIGRVFSGRVFGFAEFTDILLAEIAASETARLQQRLNVFTGGISDCVFDKKILFVLGADYGSFPAERGLSKIISERESEILKTAGIVFNDGERLMRARAAALLSSPREKLFLCRSAGRGRPSPVFGQLENIFSDVKTTAAKAAPQFTFYTEKTAEKEKGTTDLKTESNAGKTAGSLNSDMKNNAGSNAETADLKVKKDAETMNFNAENRIEKIKRESDLDAEKISEGLILNAGKTAELLNFNAENKAGNDAGRASEEAAFSEKKRRADEFLYLASRRENLLFTLLGGLKNADENNADIYGAAFTLLDGVEKQKTLSRIREIDGENGAATFADEEYTDRADELFFRAKTLRVTQAESYYRCPYMHFLRYGIRLKENDDGGLEARDAGNIMHKVLEEFIVKAKDEDGAAAAVIAESLTDKILNGERYAVKLGSPKNIGVKKRFRRDILRICADLHGFIRNSDFKPAYTEAAIADGGAFKPLSLGAGLKLTGKIDRIDLFGNYAAVFDYKTGGAPGNVVSEAYYGNNLQPFAYLAALKESGYKPSAALYLKIKDDFLPLKDAESRYRASGVVLNDAEVIGGLDNDLKKRAGRSRILPVEIKEDKDGGTTAAGSALDAEKFDALLRLGASMADGAAREIASGYMAKKPVKSVGAEACAKCDYASVCRGVRRARIQKTVDADDVFKAAAEAPPAGD